MLSGEEGVVDDVDKLRVVHQATIVTERGYDDLLGSILLDLYGLSPNKRSQSCNRR
jgi:hypothetical protein